MSILDATTPSSFGGGGSSVPGHSRPRLRRNQPVLVGVARVGVPDDAAADDPVAQIDGDHDLGAHRTRERHGHGIHERAVDENAVVGRHRREQPRHRERCADRVQRRAFAEPDLGAALERRRDGGERNLELLDRAVLEASADERHEALALEQPAAEAEVRERQHVAAPHAGRARAEALELAGRIGGADEGTDGGAADEIGSNAGPHQRPYDADVRPAARRAAPEDEAEPRHAPPARDERLLDGIGGQKQHPYETPY